MQYNYVFDQMEKAVVNLYLITYSIIICVCFMPPVFFNIQGWHFLNILFEQRSIKFSQMKLIVVELNKM